VQYLESKEFATHRLLPIRVCDKALITRRMPYTLIYWSESLNHKIFTLSRLMALYPWQDSNNGAVSIQVLC